MLAWAELWGRRASSLTSSRPSVVTNSSTAVIPTAPIHPESRTARAVAVSSSPGSPRPDHGHPRPHEPPLTPRTNTRSHWLTHTYAGKLIFWPGQAVGYLTGTLRMRVVALGDQARRSLGATWDLPGSHAEEIDRGSLRVLVLACIGRWTAGH